MHNVKKRLDFPVIDADSHIVLPNDNSWWEEIIPKKYVDWMPIYKDSRLYAEGGIVE